MKTISTDGGWAYREKIQAPSINGLSRKQLESKLKRLRKENKRLEMEREILKKVAAFFCQRAEMRFGFIRLEMKAYPVTLLCKVMGVAGADFTITFIDSTKALTMKKTKNRWGVISAHSPMLL